MREEATIRRGVRNARYAAIPNHVFEDVRLSMEARWLLGYLLSKPDNWTVVLRDIMNKGGCGRDKARRILAELVDTGYAEKEQERDGGRFSGLSLVIYDEPLTGTYVPTDDAEPAQQTQSESVAFLPQTEKPSTVNPSTETPAPVNPPLVITNNLETTDYSSERGVREIDQKENRKALDKSFWRIVKDWPNVAGMPKEAWFSEWCALTPEERIEAAEKRDAWIALLKAAGRDHIHVPGTYFREKLWKDVPDDAVKSAKDAQIRKFEPMFGPVWGAKRIMGCLAGPIKNLPDGSSTYLKSLLRQDSPAGEAERRKHLLKHGYPAVNRLDGGGILNTDDPAEELFRQRARELMVAVPVNSDGWHEWKIYCEQQGWPWVPDPGRQPVVYFPAGGPDGLNDFEAALKGLGHDGD